MTTSGVLIGGSGLVAFVMLGAGLAGSKKWGWTLQQVSLVLLSISAAAGIFTFVIVRLYFGRESIDAIWWVENLGLALMCITVGSVLACVMSFIGAAIMSHGTRDRS